MAEARAGASLGIVEMQRSMSPQKFMHKIHEHISLISSMPAQKRFEMTQTALLDMHEVPARPGIAGANHAPNHGAHARVVALFFFQGPSSLLSSLEMTVGEIARPTRRRIDPLDCEPCATTTPSRTSPGR